MNNKKICLCIFILSLIILNTIIFRAVYTQIKTSERAFRLHVTANSNNLDDQIEKLSIATKVENYICSIVQNCNNKSDIYTTLKANIDNIYNINSNISSVNIGRISYSERENKDNYMLPGTYDSINIVLGEGNGKNFWTLISPFEQQNKEKIEESDFAFFPLFTIKSDKYYESFILNKLLAH